MQRRGGYEYVLLIHLWCWDQSRWLFADGGAFVTLRNHRQQGDDHPES
jgi:hypothetical protein